MPQLTESDPAGWCAGFAAALPVDHVAVATLGDPFEIAVVAANSSTAATLTRTQLTLGEGPCWEARASRSPVLTPFLSPTAPWSALLVATHRGPALGSAYWFPLTVADLSIGAVAVYAVATDALQPRDVDTAMSIADSVSRRVLHDAVDQRTDHRARSELRERAVHQATGMVMAQLHVPAEDALFVLRVRASTEGRTLRAVAAAVVDGRTSSGE